ncbi:hypothetical protein P154DRAFT_274177 [Amniculicola lignicola CBS 123094]|uniref:F-box domain-containing protein n=1 Tax=Amniculicola lignicola CBS 123094 TaxID=1392246 RepID=A0A6A5W6N9_9PLEO|nr:hypothetical protein P154DRAFT_274177 [Amniculicola lignicola CBS 123094]
MLLPSKSVQVYPCVAAKELCTAHTPQTTRSWWFPSLFAFKSTRCILLSECPVEILDEIIDYLSPQDKIALRLTCKALWNKFGPTTKQKLKKGEHMKLLKQLQKDLPRWRLCEPCKILHGPNFNVMSLPLLARSKVQIHLQSPYTGSRMKPNSTPLKFDGPLYSLTDQHIEQARTDNSKICISALRCSDTLRPFSANLYPQPDSKLGALFNTSFKYTIKPVVSNRNFIFHATYEIEFQPNIHVYWSPAFTREVLARFDIRCCMHCSTSQLLDEMLCFVYHPDTDFERRNGPTAIAPSCMRRGTSLAADEGCGHHLHACRCVTEYAIEALETEVGRQRVVFGIRVRVWQLIGSAEQDYALRQRGYLRSWYDNSMLTEEGYM